MRDVNHPLSSLLGGLSMGAATLTGWGIGVEGAARRATGHAGRCAAPASWTQQGLGPPLVLLSGFAVSGLFWPESWVRELATRHRVILIDNRGTGGSRAAPAPFTIADLADDVAAVLGDAGEGMATVLGMSMGGMIAQELALRRPDLVDRLVLVGTIPPAPAHVPTIAYATLFGGARALAVEPALGQRLRWVLRAYLAAAANELDPDAVAEMATQLHHEPTSLVAVVNQARAISAWKNSGRLGGITVPTTVVQGAADRVVSPVNGRRVAALVPGASYVELPDVGHLVPWEAPERLLDLIQQRAG